MKSKKANSKLFLVLLLGVLSAFGPFVVDLYLPSLPQLADYFNTHASMTQLTLTTAMIGLGVGQLFIGPLSDKYGRKKPLIISLLIYVVSTVLIVFSPNIESMIVLRTLQGLSSAGSLVISRAVATDLYRGREMTRFFGLLMTINGLAPIISPILGSILIEYINWKGVFVFLALLGVVVLLFCFRLRESLLPENRQQGSIFASFAIFGNLLKNRLFMSFVGIQTLLLGAMFAYIAASPFIFQTFYGLNAVAFGVCFGVNGAALVIGSTRGAKLTNRRVMVLGMVGFSVAAIYTIAMLVIQPHWILVEMGLFTMLMMMGFTFPAISSLAMESERQNAGSASAMLGFAPFFFGGIVSPLVGIGNIFYATALVIFFCGALGLGLYMRIRRAIEG